MQMSRFVYELQMPTRPMGIRRPKILGVVVDWKRFVWFGTRVRPTTFYTRVAAAHLFREEVEVRPFAHQAVALDCHRAAKSDCSPPYDFVSHGESDDSWAADGPSQMGKGRRAYVDAGRAARH